MTAPQSFLLPLAIRILTVAAVLSPVGFAKRAQAADESYHWSVQYLIDNSQSIFGRPQSKSPRNNRSLAISPDHRYLYAGYLRTIGKDGSKLDKGELRKIDLKSQDFTKATVALLPDPVAKDLAVDEAGRVYAACEENIVVYDSNLEREIFSIPMSRCEGVAVTRVKSDIVLYASEREQHTLKRFVITAGPDGGIIKAQPSGLSGNGELEIPDAASLRGVAVDTHGNVWIADCQSNTVYRVDPNNSQIKTLSLPEPMCITFDGSRGYVSLGSFRAVAVIDDQMNILGKLDVPWDDLELSAYGNNRMGILGGIVADPGKGFYVANGLGQTAGQRSTYGELDDKADVIKEKLYHDAESDDDDPILHAVIARDGDSATDASNPSANPADLSKQPNPADLSKQAP